MNLPLLSVSARVSHSPTTTTTHAHNRRPFRPIQLAVSDALVVSSSPTPPLSAHHQSVKMSFTTIMKMLAVALLVGDAASVAVKEQATTTGSMLRAAKPHYNPHTGVYTPDKAKADQQAKVSALLKAEADQQAKAEAD